MNIKCAHRFLLTTIHAVVISDLHFRCNQNAGVYCCHHHILLTKRATGKQISEELPSVKFNQNLFHD